MSSSIPHLHAAHWMISSVVPANAPSTLLNPDQSERVLAFARLPALALAAAFSGRISAAGRTNAAHCAPEGSTAPTGNVEKCPDGDGGVVVVRVSSRRSGPTGVKPLPLNHPVTSTTMSASDIE